MGLRISRSFPLRRSPGPDLLLCGSSSLTPAVAWTPGVQATGPSHANISAKAQSAPFWVGFGHDDLLF